MSLCNKCLKLAGGMNTNECDRCGAVFKDRIIDKKKSKFRRILNILGE